MNSEMTNVEWLQEPKFYLVGYSYVASRIIYALFMAYMAYYVKFSLLLEEQYIAIIPLCMFIAGLIISGILKIAVKQFGPNAMFFVSAIIGTGKRAYNLHLYIYVSFLRIMTRIFTMVIAYFEN